MADDAAVQYTVKELIARLDGKMDVLIEKVDNRVDLLDRRVTALELSQETAKTALRTTRYIVLVAAPAIAGLVAHIVR